MASIKTQHFDGDTSFGRNVAVGGKANIQGSATIGHNLIVKGWLDAANIKGPNKGLFADATALREAYPNPHEGWWALVGPTLPAPIYNGRGGEWVATGEVGGNPTIDSAQYNQAIQSLSEELAGIVEDINSGKTDISTLKERLSSLNDSILVEIGNRTQGDATLQENIEAEKQQREAADTTLQGNIDEERRLREAADTTLQGNIEAEAAERTQGDATLQENIEAEKQQREAADTTLQGNIDEERRLREAADTTLQGNIEAEAAERTQGDATLQGNIDEERRQREADRTELENSIQEISGSIGEADGIASLGYDGTVPDEQISLAHKSAIIFFERFVGGIVTAQQMSTSQMSSDEDVSIVFNKTSGAFLCETPSPSTPSAKLYYTNWGDASLFGGQGIAGRVPFSHKLYVNKSDNMAYRFDANEGKMVSVGVTLDEIREQLSPITFINAAKVWSDNPPTSLSEVISRLEENAISPADGLVVTFEGIDAWESYQYQGGDASDEENWRKFGGGASVGNCYNVTAARSSNGESLPTSPATYDTKQSAIEYAIQKRAVGIGVQITFASSATTWKTYQYIGLSDDAEAYANLSNWLDVAGQSAGDEQVVNINYLCKDISIATTYNLADAINALTALKTQTSTDYVKAGMVITYKTGEGEWEAKQLIGGAADYTNPDAWKDFGGGSTLAANDSPEDGGTDAFSTGGAYQRLITNFNEEISGDGTTKTYQAVNAKGQPIGDPIEIPLNQGGGGGSTSVSSFRIVFENNPIYAAVGGEIKGRMAARSYSQEGEEVIYNKITRIEILDATTGLVLSVRTLTGESSSASLSDFKFELDFTSLFAGAGSREFTVRVTDQEGNLRSQNISVVAVDVTVEITKPLNECLVTAGNGMTNLDNFYRFEKNALKKDGGIDAIMEILWDGEWRELGEANVTDTFSKSIVINPSNLLGGNERMTHGAYLLRVHGYAPNARVSGNYVYTTIMCVDPMQGDVPVVGIRFDAKNPISADEAGERTTLAGGVALYDNAVFQIAAYTGGSVSGNTTVSVYANDEAISAQNMAVSQVYRVSYQIQGFHVGDTIEFKAVGEYVTADGVGVNRGSSPTIGVVVTDSAIDVILKEGAAFGYDFALRTNADADKTISDNGVTMSVSDANWRSNGFGTYLGERCLRIAENVTAGIPYRPFGFGNVESSGLAVQFAFATNNIKDSEAMLMHCYDPSMGAGFYVKGNVAGIYCAKGQGRNKVEERKFRCGEKITMAVVVEPSSIYHERQGIRYSNIKMYLNGEEVACLAYIPEQSAISQSQPIMFDGHDGDFYLYYIMAYQSHYPWVQAFTNYLAKQTDVTAMISEYDSEDVLNDLGAPSLDKMKAKKMPYYVVSAPQQVFDEYDSDVDTSKKFYCTLYYFNPEYPCLNFKATDVQWRRQGTTSAKRPVKNDRFYLAASKGSTYDKKTGSGGTSLELLNPDERTELGRKAIALAAKNYTLVRPNGIPVQTITVKVDYSDSSNANDCGVCDMMNSTFRALGREYQTPAQRAYDGTFTKGSLTVTGCVMDHSTKNHPIAAFRATDDTLTDAWFHAKGNWKEDKAEQVALGFQKTPGYNLGCKNYGDFVEYFGLKAGDERDGSPLDHDETLDEIEARFKSEAAQDGSGIDKDKLYLLSLYCGRDYRFMRYNQPTEPSGTGSWEAQSGSMRQVDGHWVVDGTVLNPVTGFELLAYQGFDWWQGVSSVEAMMDMQPGMSSWVKKLKDGGKVSASTFPAWTQYFECMVDDDQLQIDLALGKKVPYDLYRMMKFCDDCNMVQAVAGQENRWEKVRDDAKIANWRNNLWKYASPHSVYAYTLFTDYEAATDQRAKNMQPMWFLEDGYSVTDGVYSADEAVRMYLNKVYDCDTCNGKDNDGGCTVDAECDPNKFTDDTYTNPYSGYGSTLFANTDITEWVYLDGTHSSNKQLSLKTVAAAMRTARTTVDGVEMTPFSPEGAQYFFVEKRLKFWKKLISSFDGEHKYIEFTSSADALYFYALQGLGLTALPQFIEQRWRFRDGYYQTGNFFSGVLSGRIACASSSAKIRIKAAKTGFFGIGHDASGNLDEAVFLEAGEEWEFTRFSHQESALLYIYQSDRMSEIDLSEISLDGTFNFGVMTLVEKLTIGGESHIDVSIGSYTALSTVMLGNLPFLKELDLRNTTATSVDASGCPRIESILADGSQLTSCTLAETSPITTLHLPATMNELNFINLPELVYPATESPGTVGLTIAGMSNVQKVMVSGCPKIDALGLIEGLTQSSTLRAVGLRDVNITASVGILRSLKAMQVYGLDENGNDIAADKGENGRGLRCSGLTGRWISRELIEESELNELKAYFRGLGEQLYNSQYSTIVFDDVATASANITNLDNNTGYESNTEFEPSGHFAAIERKSHAYKCAFNTQEAGGTMHCWQLSDTNYGQLADGSDIDLTDTSGEGFDIMKHLPRYWYKGINDFKNQKKYLLASSNAPDKEPLSTARRTTRQRLSDILVRPLSCLYSSALEVGDSYSLADNPNMSVYAMDVEGMKQVRWPGVNNQLIGAAFVDGDDKVVGKFNMAVSHALFDFVFGDYVFCDVPVGAKRIVFTSPTGFDDLEAIAVDSDALEAIEPDWVLTDDRLVGVYGMFVDSLMRPRSISNAKTRTGDNTNVTNPDWRYDSEGNVTNASAPTSAMHYTYQDMLNLCELRGKGYHSISYEMSKDIANLVYALVGDRDIQALCGNGCSSQYTTGANGMNSLGNTTKLQSRGAGTGNLIFGIQNFVGCNWEIMDYVAVNVSSFAEFKARKRIAGGNDQVDGKWHIYDPVTKTERVVAHGNITSGYCIGRMKFGRYADIIASRTTNDNSRWEQNYSDAYYYIADRGRCVGRAYSGAYASGGLACSYAVNASSYSSTYFSARLTFSGRIVFEAS